MAYGWKQAGNIDSVTSAVDFFMINSFPYFAGDATTGGSSSAWSSFKSDISYFESIANGKPLLVTQVSPARVPFRVCAKSAQPLLHPLHLPFHSPISPYDNAYIYSNSAPSRLVGRPPAPSSRRTVARSPSLYRLQKVTGICSIRTAPISSKRRTLAGCGVAGMIRSPAGVSRRAEARPNGTSVRRRRAEIFYPFFLHDGILTFIFHLRSRLLSTYLYFLTFHRHLHLVVWCFRLGLSVDHSYFM